MHLLDKPVTNCYKSAPSSSEACVTLEGAYDLLAGFDAKYGKAALKLAKIHDG